MRLYRKLLVMIGAMTFFGILFVIGCCNLPVEQPSKGFITVSGYTHYEVDIPCKAMIIHYEAAVDGLNGLRGALDVVEARSAKTGRYACQEIKKTAAFSAYVFGLSATEKMINT